MLFTVIRSFPERSKNFNDNLSFDKTSNIADNCAVDISVLTRLRDLRLEIEAAKVSQFKVVFPSIKKNPELLFKYFVKSVVELPGWESREIFLLKIEISSRLCSENKNLKKGGMLVERSRVDSWYHLKLIENFSNLVTASLIQLPSVYHTS